MNEQLKKLQEKLLERKSWIDAIEKINDVSLNYIGLFQNVDDAYAIEKIETNEVDYQDLLRLLRGVQLTTLEANAKFVDGLNKFFPATMFDELNDLTIINKNQN
jgi:hypothetical protein